MKHVTRIALASALAISATTADARRAGGVGGWGLDLQFRSETTLPMSSGGSYSLCHLVDQMTFLFVPVYTTLDGYAISETGCEGDEYIPFTSQQMTNFQDMGLIPADIPATPKLSAQELMAGHAWLILGAIVLMFKILIGLRSRSSKPRRRLSKEAEMQTLAAMCHVAVADGTIDEREVKEISSIMSRLTGKSISFGQINTLLRDMRDDPIDPSLLGQDLKPGEKEVVMEASLNIAVADGQMDPREHSLVSEIAQALQIRGPEFRSALQRISGHLAQTNPA